MEKINFLKDAYTQAFKELVHLAKLVITERDFDSFVKALNGKEIQTKGDIRIADVTWQNYEYALMWYNEDGCEIAENLD